MHRKITLGIVVGTSCAICCWAFFSDVTRPPQTPRLLPETWQRCDRSKAEDSHAIQLVEYLDEAVEPFSLTIPVDHGTSEGTKDGAGSPATLRLREPRRLPERETERIAAADLPCSDPAVRPASASGEADADLPLATRPRAMAGAALRRNSAVAARLLSPHHGEVASQQGGPELTFPTSKNATEEPSPLIFDAEESADGANDPSDWDIQIPDPTPRTASRKSSVSPTVRAKTSDTRRGSKRNSPAELTDESSSESLAPVVEAPLGDPWRVQSESQLSTSQHARRQRIRQCLEFYYNRQLNTVDDSPWSMMHHMIAWGSDSLIWSGTVGQSKRVSCIGWLCANGLCEGERLLFARDGKLYARTGPGLQGHAGQFLAMLAQARVPAEQPLRVDGQMFTVRDLVEQEKSACRPSTELTFRLIGITHYLGTEAEWQSSDGQPWNISRLIREEIKQPINGVTCGGTHRLMGLSYAVRKRQQEGLPVDGQFARAEKYTADYRDYTFAGQNPDGSFSSDFWRSRGNWGDIDRKLKTTGHMLEWMIFATPHGELEDPRLLEAVDYLTMLLMSNRYFDWGKGPLGHGVRALSLYDERVFGGVPGQRELHLAEKPPRILPKEDEASSRPTSSKATPRRSMLFRRSR